MSNPNIEAADAVKNLNKTLRGIFLVGERLEAIGSLEAAAEDARKQLEPLNAEIARRKAELVKLNEKSKAAVGEAEGIIANAHAQVAAVTDKAAADADAVLGLASAQAADLVSRAEGSAQSVRAAAAQDKARVDSEVRAAMQNVRDLTAAAQDAEKRLQDAQRAYAELRAKVA